MASFDKNSDGRIEMLEVRMIESSFIWDAPTELESKCRHLWANLSVTLLMWLFVLPAPVGSAFAHRRELPAVFQGVCGIQL